MDRSSQPFTVYQTQLPAVLKLEFGTSAVGVKHVHSLQEAVQHAEEMLRFELDHPGAGLGHGHALIMMPRLVGSEHDVEVVLFEGQLMAAYLSDNGPTRLPLCAETAAAMPSLLRKGGSVVLSPEMLSESIVVLHIGERVHRVLAAQR